MNYIIIDDEPLAREGIELNAKEVDFLSISGSFSSPFKASNLLADQAVDLMFLDIQMPGINGLDFLKSLDNPPLTILTTAHSEFAIDGFNLNVIDYLVKPIRLERFLRAVFRAREYFDLKQKAHTPQQIKTQNTNDNDNTIFVKSDRKYIKLLLDDIVFIEGMKDYVMVHTVSDRYPVAMNLKSFHSNLPGSKFARVNRSNVINVKYVTEISNNHVVIPNRQFSIGRTFRDDFLDNHIKEKLIDRN